MKGILILAGNAWIRGAQFSERYNLNRQLKEQQGMNKGILAAAGKSWT